MGYNYLMIHLPQVQIRLRNQLELFRFLPRRSRKAGLPPGTPVHIGDKRKEAARLTVLRYNQDSCTETEQLSPEDCLSPDSDSLITWINLDGVHDVETVQHLGKLFGIHPLVQEDIVNTGQRSKVESYEEALFITLKMLVQDTDEVPYRSEQVSLFVRPGLIISFQEQAGDVFDPVRDRLRKGKGYVRTYGSDYLAYCLIDVIVDQYFLILEGLEDRIQPLEEMAVGNPEPDVMVEIQNIKRELIFLRRTLWPLREMLSRLERDGSSLIRKETSLFIRDVYDHTIQIIEILESFQEIVTGIMDIYLTSISNRMNTIMKVLTIIATIFIPLTFVAGVYGMNFRVMPELEWAWGYPAVLTLMGLVFAGMVVFFRRKKWL
jgi:magnesium transporter